MRPIVAICACVMLAACHHTNHDSARIPDPPPPIPMPTTDATVRTIVDPVPRPPDPEPAKIEPNLPPAPEPAKVIAETNDKLVDIFFGYDRSDLSPEALAAVERDARFLAPVLAEFPAVKLTIEGHCDERGSAEYNIALGDHRASQAAAALRSLGVPAGRLDTISYGKERPQCDEPNEPCWRTNRRAHPTLFLPASGTSLP